ncbi:hypothetical protein GCM10027418_29870 [Mariniluteicoccus endophyticus]
MFRNLAGGCLLAIGAAVVLTLGSGSQLEHLALVGAALGGALGLVPAEQHVGRFIGFALGFVLAWAGFAVRAAVLPDSTAGRAVAAAVVIALLAVVAVASRDRVPLWSALLGCAALVAAYETTYTEAPARFLTESPQAATTMLLACAVGVLTTTLAHGVRVGGRGPAEHDEADAPADPDRHAHHADSDDPILDDALGGRA